MRKTLVKGSKAAKDFMAKLRAKKGAVKKTIKRVAKNAKQSFKDGYYAKDKVGSTLLINKGENPRAKPKRVIQVNRTKKGAFKKFKTISGVKKHTDTKSHNVNISVVSGVINVMDVKRDLDKSILLLEGAKMATIDKNNTNYLTQNKPLVFKNITEKKSFIKQYTKQVKILKDLYRNTLKNKLNK